MWMVATTSLAGKVKTLVRAAGEGITDAADFLRAGQLVAFATETVYGLGADATQAAAVRRIYKVKRRPADNPLIVHVLNQQQAEDYAVGFDDVARILARRFWPGPLTMVVGHGSKIPPEVSAGTPTMAVRCPSHWAAQRLLASLGRPIAAPSANLSGHVSPTTAADVLAELGGRIPLILDGGRCRVGVESTVIDLTVDPPVVLRPGSVTVEMIRAALRRKLGTRVRAIGTSSMSGNAVSKSPGMSKRHYAPVTPTYRYLREEWHQVRAWLNRYRPRARVVRLSCEKSGAAGGQEVLIHLSANGEQCARHLYKNLRTADSRGYDLILVEMPPDRGHVWTAIRDRIRRASQEWPP